jgi:predicted MPP superfamily phosphohydrolase
MPPRLAAGLIRMGTAILHTSPGLGTSKYAPFRFACRPEATLLELRAGRRATGGPPSGDPTD